MEVAQTTSTIGAWVQNTAKTMVTTTRGRYWTATALATGIAALPLIKLALMIVLGMAISFTPVGWILLGVGVGLFAIASIAFACLSKEPPAERAKTILKGVACMLIPPVATLIAPLFGTGSAALVSSLIVGGTLVCALAVSEGTKREMPELIVIQD